MAKSNGSDTSIGSAKGSPIDMRPSSGMALNTTGPKIGQGYNQYPKNK